LSERQRVPIGSLPTGVPGLDAVLGGGLPEYSFNLIAGGPGAGKTTLAQQIMFANATSERPALFFTVLGEPPMKMLRYQQQFGFFDHAKVGSAIRFINLSQEMLDDGLGAVLEKIVHEVEDVNPGIVVVDSFRSVIRASRLVDGGDLELVGFVQRLALHLTSWQATTFLVGEYPQSDAEENPVTTIADGILWLSQNQDRNSVVRKLQAMKMRGRAPLPGLHTFRITDTGLQVFPRILKRSGPEARQTRPLARLATGVPGLDEMLGGGFPIGDAVLVAGPAGSGKSALASQFVAEGLRQGENGVIAVFEERPDEYVARADELGMDLGANINGGRLEVIYLRPLDLSVDEALLEIQDAVRRTGAQRLAIDSLSGFELALAPTFREDFRESLYRMVGALTGSGVTVFMTVEVTESFNDLRFSPHAISFLTDAIVVQRYVELGGQLRKVMAVVKMRRGEHSRDIRLYDVGPSGLVVGDTLRGYRGIITGTPEQLGTSGQARYPGLTDAEVTVLLALDSAQGISISAASRSTGLDRRELASALARLVALGHAVRVGEGAHSRYRRVVRSPET
jgi:circadian clock protein KaiC